MRASKSAERSMAKLAQMLAAHGIKQDVIEEVKEAAPTDKNAISRQGEAVLLCLESPAKFTTKLCKRCGEPFGTNYRSVAYCSDGCRARAIQEQLGVKWDWLKPEEQRWGGEPPLIIPPVALKKMREFFEFFATIPESQTQTEIQREVHLPEELEPDYIPLSMSPPNGTQKVRDTLTPSPPEYIPASTVEESDPFDF